jgi:ribonuclease BN (tRNA processing enzyme)
MLMECGANAPSAVWNKSTRADYLDGIFVSHFHADHTFGLPALVMRMWEDGRTRPFYLFGPVGSQRYIERMMKMAYPSMVNVPFTLRFRELQRSHRWDDWNLRVVSTRHSVPNLGLRLEAGSPQKVFCYSGDGMFTPTAAKLYTGADLLVHEAYLEDGQTKTHCSLVQLERLQELARPKQMALVHLQRNLRKQKDDILKRYRRRKWTIPDAGDSVTC